MKDFFTFSGKERNGIIFLSVIIIMLLIFQFFIPSFITKDKGDFQLIEQEVEHFKNSAKKISQTNEKRIKEEKGRNKQFKKFDPNDASQEAWTNFGLSKGQVKVIKNYLNNGGVFNNKEDLKKIYVIDENTYNKIAPYLLFEKDTNKKENKFSFNLENKKVKKIEINGADKQELMSLRGIGDVYAGRIIKYRKLLGGFVRKEQLLEVYGLDTNLYNNISKHIIINTDSVKVINLNNCSFHDLIRHPYINSYQAKAVMSFRKGNYEFHSIQQVIDNNIFSDEQYNEIKKYLVL